MIGRVSLWGTVVECEEGWRAAFAYPACIFVPRQAGVSRPGRDLFDALSAYGVPVLPFAWPGTWDPSPQPQLPFFPKAAA